MMSGYRYTRDGHPFPRIRRGLHMAGWNALLLMVGLALIALVSEGWLRLTMPFVESDFPRRFVPNVGSLGKPNAEVRATNNIEFWTVSQTNSLGFLDREPINLERAATSCHITVIGDSFVEAAEIAVADKFHVRMEALAARELPHLDITTSAFGRSSTGQIGQLPFYDEYARHMSPKIVVLVVYSNDLLDNSTIWYEWYRGLDADRGPFVSARKDEDGKIRLHPPVQDYALHRLARGTGLSESTAHTLKKMWEKVRGSSHFLDWLYSKARIVFYEKFRAEQSRSLVSDLPLLFDGKQDQGIQMMQMLAAALGEPESAEEDLHPIFQDALDMTAFALDQLKARADRDGATLVILAHGMRVVGNEPLNLWNAMAEARGIHLIDLHDYIIRRGGKEEKTRWIHDIHWNSTGHQWAAEALLEYLNLHPGVCNGVVTERFQSGTMTNDSRLFVE